MQNKNIRIEKYVNKENISEQLAEIKTVKDNTTVSLHSRYADNSESKELNQLKNLLSDKKSLNDYM